MPPAGSTGVPRVQMRVIGDLDMVAENSLKSRSKSVGARGKRSG